MARRSIAAYKKVQATTASPGQRVVMVYEGIRKNLKLAYEAIESGNPEGINTANNSVQLSQQLINELKYALDMRAGEVAITLRDLYDFWLRHLSEANSTKDAQKIREIYDMVEDLGSGWKEAARKG